MSEDPDCFAVLAEVSQQVNFDQLMSREPSTLTREDRKLLIRLQRSQRAQWQAKADDRRAKKEEKEND